jgi:beta-glucosidase
MTSRPFILAAALVLAAGAVPSTQMAPAMAPVRLSSFDGEVNALLAKMTLDEKVGQMTQPDQMFLADPNEVETYFLGSVLSGGDSDPKTNTVEDWADMYDRLQAHALETRLKIPLLYGVDAVHGHSNVIGAVIFPHNIGLGATRNAKLVEQIGRITAKEVRATGVNWAFAPCVAVVRDERWGRTYEGFSEDPQLVAELGEAATRGLQADGLANPLGVLACAKHYAGDGGTTFGTGTPESSPGQRVPLDQGDVRMSEEELRRIHLPGYITAIRAGVGTIMPSYSSWNGVKASASRRLLTEILKEELGFEGFLISDYNAIDQIPGDYRSDIKTSINAGMDMVMVPQNYKAFFTNLKSLVEANEVPTARIDDAVRRILRVKFAMGLMKPGAKVMADRTLMESFGSAAHRAVARQAVRESLVLLKNENGRLPLARTLGRIHVAGKNADDIGNQSGGWTITWQGKSGATTTGTTILEGIQYLAGQKTKITYSKDGSGASGADVGVVVVGETPYAEMFGDRTDLSLSKQDLDTIRTVKQAGVPVVVVLVSGRPVIVTEALEMTDAFVAAWLPGTEGTGVADVLYGDYEPTGKLPFTWPRSNDQLPINVGDAQYDPLFAYGFGLTY